jgi:hypothetical protein
MQYAHFKNTEAEAINQFLVEHPNFRALDYVGDNVCITHDDKPYIGATKDSLIGFLSGELAKAQQARLVAELNVRLAKARSILNRGGTAKKEETAKQLAGAEENLEVMTTRARQIREMVQEVEDGTYTP